MRRSRRSLAGMAFFCVAVALAYCTHTVEAERPIPAGIPSDVRKQIVALRSEDPVKRAQAARDLGYMKSKVQPAIPFLVDLLADDAKFSDASLRPFTCVARTPIDTSPGEQAAYALANIGSPALESIMEALKSPNAVVRTNAVFSLRWFNETHQESKAPVNELIALLLHDPSPDVRAGAADALELIQKPAVYTALLSATKDKDAHVRERVIVDIGFFRHPRIAPILLDALGDPSPGVRRAAIDGLEELYSWGKDLLAVKMAPAVRAHEDMEAWKKLDYKQIAEAFIAGMHDPSGEVRCASYYACKC